MTLAERAARLRPAEIVALLPQNAAWAQPTADLQRQGAWFKRQLLGRKSERRLRAPDAQQLPLVGLFSAQSDPAEPPPPPPEAVKAYQRRAPFTALVAASEGGLRLDPSVPGEVVVVPNPEVAGLSPDAYEVMGEKVTYRVAQRPGADVILK